MAKLRANKSASNPVTDKQLEKDLEVLKKQDEKEVEVNGMSVEDAKKEEGEKAVRLKSAVNPASDKEVKEAEADKVDAIVNSAVSNSVQASEILPEVEKPKKGNPNVRVKPNQDIRTYIGNQWYNLKKGKQETVPASVKNILQKAGMLDVL